MASRSGRDAAPSSGSPRSLSGLLPFLRPYRGRIALALLFLLGAALRTLFFQAEDGIRDKAT